MGYIIGQMTILTVNKPEKGTYSQKEIEKTKLVLTAYSEKFPEDIDYWILDPRGAIDVSGIKHEKAFFLAEFKHYEADRKDKIRVKWSELLAIKAASLPLFAWIEAEGKEWFIYISADAIPFSITELQKQADILSAKGNQRRTQINFFDNKVQNRYITGEMSLVTLEDAVQLLKREVDKYR